MSSAAYWLEVVKEVEGQRWEAALAYSHLPTAVAVRLQLAALFQRRVDRFWEVTARPTIPSDIEMNALLLKRYIFETGRTAAAPPALLECLLVVVGPDLSCSSVLAEARSLLTDILLAQLGSIDVLVTALEGLPPAYWMRIDTRQDLQAALPALGTWPNRRAALTVLAALAPRTTPKTRRIVWEQTVRDGHFALARELDGWADTLAYGWILGYVPERRLRAHDAFLRDLDRRGAFITARAAAFPPPLPWPEGVVTMAPWWNSYRPFGQGLWGGTLGRLDNLAFALTMEAPHTRDALRILIHGGGIGLAEVADLLGRIVRFLPIATCLRPALDLGGLPRASVCMGDQLLREDLPSHARRWAESAEDRAGICALLTAMVRSPRLDAALLDVWASVHPDFEAALARHTPPRIEPPRIPDGTGPVYDRATVCVLALHHIGDTLRRQMRQVYQVRHLRTAGLTPEDEDVMAALVATALRGLEAGPLPNGTWPRLGAELALFTTEIYHARACVLAFELTP
jgi:hypothetical protein